MIVKAFSAEEFNDAAVLILLCYYVVTVIIMFIS